jgi:hypothetical protein
MPPNSVIRQWTAKRILVFVLGNAFSLFFGLYGLKCIAFMHGRIPVHEAYTSRFSFHLAPVSGVAAALAGLGYIGLALFATLSCGPPPSEDRSWLWRMGRGFLRWGSLIIGFLAWQKVYKMRP